MAAGVTSRLLVMTPDLVYTITHHVEITKITHFIKNNVRNVIHVQLKHTSTRSINKIITKMRSVCYNIVSVQKRHRS